jgi:hypothetical protein
VTASAPVVTNPPARARLSRPFEGDYGVSLAVAILALVPFITVSTAILLFCSRTGGLAGAVSPHIGKFGGLVLQLLGHPAQLCGQARRG